MSSLKPLRPQAIIFTGGRIASALLLVFGLCGNAYALGGGTKEKLRRGGYVILMRHAEAQPNLAEKPNPDPKDCSTQRNLLENARAEMRNLGERLKRTGIRVSKSLASELCRARQTAQLFSPETEVEVRPELDPLTKRTAQERAQAVAKIRAEIAAWRGPGNLLIVSHKSTLKVLTKRSLGQGSYLVVDPRSMKIIAEDD
jgi:phosphohistidine phosphatase SixA